MIRRRRALRHLEEDLRDHIARETRDNIERGMAPKEARAAALRKFGNVTRVMEDTRAVWTWIWLEQLLQDIRYGVRGLRRNPGFAAVVVLTLALGIGMNTAVFTLVNAILVRPLPYPDPNRLVWVAEYNPRIKSEWVPGPDFADWRAHARSFESMVAYGYQGATLATAESAEQHRIAEVTPAFWPLSGTKPALGRLFTSGDRAALVLSDRLFQKQFHRDPRVIGRRVTLDGAPFTVVGVLPREFRSFLPQTLNFGAITGGSQGIDAYVPNPIDWEPAVRSHVIELVIAKLKPGVPIEQAGSELNGIQARIARENQDPLNRPQALVTPLQDKLVGGARPALLVLLAAVIFVLLIACANIANLLLARGGARQKEIAIRAALGAGRARVMRQFLGENLGFALLGGAVGLVFARLAVPVIVRLAPQSLPRLAEAGMDGRVLLFALASSLVTGVIFGISPALFLGQSNPYDALKQGGRTSAAGTAGVRVRRFLVAAELALSIVLLAGAGLMIKSFWRMNAHPPAFVPERILTLKVTLTGPQYRTPARQQSFARTMLERVANAPGVEAAGLIGNFASLFMTTPDTSPASVGRAPAARLDLVSSGLDRALGIRLVRGRWVTEHETRRVAVVNESLARAVFGAGDPIGKQLSVPGSPQQPEPAVTIVGVVGDLKYRKLDANPEPEAYFPYQRSWSPFPPGTLMVRTTSDAAPMASTIRNLVANIDHTQPVYDVKTLDEALAESIAPRRFNLFLLATFAGSALLLAMIGIYGVIAYTVAQRTHEIGVRMALGAQRGEVVRLVVREGMSLAAAGIAAGLAAAFGLTRLMSSLLYDVKPNDPSTYAVVAFALVATALAACCKPALRAAWVDPASALREE